MDLLIWMDLFHISKRFMVYVNDENLKFIVNMMALWYLLMWSLWVFSSKWHSRCLSLSHIQSITCMGISILLYYLTVRTRCFVNHNITVSRWLPEPHFKISQNKLRRFYRIIGYWLFFVGFSASSISFLENKNITDFRLKYIMWLNRFICSPWTQPSS